MEDVSTPYTQRFVSNLRQHCDGRQRDVAAKAGITREHLSKILNGHATPTLDTAANLADAVGIPLPLLLTEMAVTAS